MTFQKSKCLSVAATLLMTFAVGCGDDTNATSPSESTETPKGDAIEETPSSTENGNLGQSTDATDSLGLTWVVYSGDGDRAEHQELRKVVPTFPQTFQLGTPDAPPDSALNTFGPGMSVGLAFITVSSDTNGDGVIGEDDTRAGFVRRHAVVFVKEVTPAILMAAERMGIENASELRAGFNLGRSVCNETGTFDALELVDSSAELSIEAFDEDASYECLNLF